MKEIRIGLVGSGWMGKAHSSALADAEMLFGPDYGTASFEIVADANEEAAKSAQKKIGFKRISTDWNDVVTDPNVDLVDIATPNAFHYVVAKAALENGKNVYCEKPLSISAEESKELAELAKKKGVVNYVGFNNTQNPANAYVRELVQSALSARSCASPAPTIRTSCSTSPSRSPGATSTSWLAAALWATLVLTCCPSPSSSWAISPR